MEPNEKVLNWIHKHPCDPLVAALRVLATSSNMNHEEAFLRLTEIVGQEAGVPEFVTNAEERATEAAIREWFDSREIINGQDVWIFLLCTIRYSMGRMTYMPSMCLDFYKQYGKHLEFHQRKQIKEEIETELRRVESNGGYLGHECDHKTWRRFAEVISVDLDKSV